MTSKDQCLAIGHGVIVRTRTLGGAMTMASLPAVLLSIWIFGVCAYVPAQAAEIRIHEMENISSHDFEIESKGLTPKPSLVIVDKRPSSFRSSAMLPNLEINSDTSSQWHIYADHTEFRRSGYGLVDKHVLFFGFIPVTVAIPADYALSMRTTLLEAGYKLSRDSRADWGLATGLGHYDAHLSVLPTVPNQEGQSGAAHVTLPMLGAFVEFKATDKITLNMRFQGTTFGSHHREKQVRTAHLRLGADWQLNSTMALGLGYLRSTFDYFSQKATYQSHYGADAAATSVYMKFSF